MEVDSDLNHYNKKGEAYKHMLKHAEASKILFPDKEFGNLDNESNKKVKAIYKIVKKEIVANKIAYSSIKEFSRKRFGELQSLVNETLINIISNYKISPVISPVRKAVKIARSAPAHQAIKEEGNSASSEHASRERLRRKKTTVASSVTIKTDRIITSEYETKLKSINDNEKAEIKAIISKYTQGKKNDADLLSAFKYLGDETDPHARPPEGFTSWADLYLKKTFIPKRQELEALRSKVEHDKLDAFNKMQDGIVRNHTLKENKTSEYNNTKKLRATTKSNKRAVEDLADLLKKNLGGGKRR